MDFTGKVEEADESIPISTTSTRLEALLANRIKGLRVNMFFYTMGHA
jgi:hypothetical protein